VKRSGVKRNSFLLLMGSLENFSGHFNLIWESDQVINNARKRPSLSVFDFLQKIIEHAYLLDNYPRCHGILLLVVLEPLKLSVFLFLTAIC